MKKLRPQGFTLIEIAIVIALMMFLALFVYPTYSTYLKRAKVSESLILASTAKIAVLHNATNNVPLTSIWTPPTPTDTVRDIAIHITDTTGISLLSHGELLANLPSRHAGEIVIVFSSDIAPAAHNELILSPRQADTNKEDSNGHELALDLTHISRVNSINWECNSANPPALNRGTRGTLYAKLAPAECRA